MPLTTAQLQQFSTEGFLILPGLITGDLHARMMQLLQGLVASASQMQAPTEHYSLSPDAEGKPTAGRLHKVQGVCVVEPHLLQLASAPEIVSCVVDLLGSEHEIDVFGTKFFPMSRAGSTSTGWHQDNHYFGTNSNQVVSCAIYLEETGVENGCLMVLPGSHRTGDIVKHTSGTGVYAHGQWADVDESKAVDVVCPPGTVVLFSANLLHGARPNTSGKSSYRTAWHYFPANLELKMFPRGVYSDRYTVYPSNA